MTMKRSRYVMSCMKQNGTNKQKIFLHAKWQLIWLIRNMIIKESILKSVHKEIIGEIRKKTIDKDKNSCEVEVFGPVVHTLEGIKQVG